MTRYRVASHPLKRFLAEHGAQWWALYHGDPDATPFQRPDWVEVWWDCFGWSQEAGLVVTVHADGDLTTVLPLALRSNDAGRSSLTCIGEYVFDYCGWVSHPSADHDATLARITAHLADEFPTGSLRLTNLRARTALRAAVAGLAGHRPVAVEVADLCPRVLFGPGWHAYWAARGRNLRQSVARARRRWAALDAGPVTVDAPSTADLDAFVELHLGWWRAQARESMLEDAEFRQFLTTAWTRLAGTGAVTMSCQRIGSTVAAMFLFLEDRTARYYYQSALAVEFAALQPGLVHMSGVAELTSRQGFACLDLLRGDERYKLQFASEVRDNVTASVALG